MASSAAAPPGFCYSDVPGAGNPAGGISSASHLVTQIQPGYDPSQAEIFNLTPTSMDMIGFPKTNNHQHLMNWQENKQMFVDDSSLRCVFPCEGNERPSQGLSLSLSSTDPSSIGLQSFELRHASSSHSQSQSQQQFQLRSSKYLGPAQALLNEFCSLGTKQQQMNDQALTKQKPTHKTNSSRQWEDDPNHNNGSNISSSSSSKPLNSLEFMELQKRKTKLLSLLEEVDRRYRHYCDQMKAVVSSFESVAGSGAATVYSALASKAMSRHFRCLRDGIIGQIHATKKAMGEKDPIAPGTSRGETPRLRILDQTLRQQRAFQQMSMMESHPWRPQRGLPERSVSVLRAWLFEHFLHPYPSDVDKHILARQTGLSRSQVSNWFINARVRLWKPMVEEMYLEETKDHDSMGMSPDGITDPTVDDGSHLTQNPQAVTRLEDQKPSTDQLVRIDSECLSSIITTPDKNPDHSKGARNAEDHVQPAGMLGQHSFGRVGDSFAGMELDFSSYHHHHSSGSVPFGNENPNHFNGGSGVSLTLGLQHHSGTGVSLAFSPATQSSLFYPRDHIEDCQPVQYSLLDAEGQNLPYRNLMGAQLLHDLAG